MLDRPPVNDPLNPNNPANRATPATSGPSKSSALGDPSNLKNMSLSQQPDFAFAQMMEMIGLAPGNQGGFGAGIAKMLKPLFQAHNVLGGLQGDGKTNMIDNQTNSLNSFVNTILGGGSSAMGDLQGYANSTLGNIRGMGSKIADPNEQQRYMDAALALSTAGDNPMIRQAMADQNIRAQYGFDKAQHAGLGSKDGPKNYINWIGKQDDSQFEDIIRLFGGR